MTELTALEALISTPDSKYSKTFSSCPARAARKNAVLGSL